MSLEISGQITKVLDLQSGEKKDGSGQWQKQLFLVDTKEQYNSLYCFEIFGKDKVDNFNDHHKEGDSVTVVFNVNTSEYQGRYFTTLSAWQIRKNGVGSASEYQAPTQSAGDEFLDPNFGKPQEFNQGDENNDVPF